MLLREHDHVDRLAGGNGRDSSTYRKTPWDLYLYDENSFSSLSLLAPGKKTGLGGHLQEASFKRFHVVPSMWRQSDVSNPANHVKPLKVNILPKIICIHWRRAPLIN